MIKQKTSQQLPSPLVVEVTRGNMVESIHSIHAAVVRYDNQVLKSWGDPEKIVYARSAIKPLQALPLIESGAADHFGLADHEIALACASHEGEEIHTNAVTAWLQKIGCSEHDLCCGVHTPYHGGVAEELIRTGRKPSPVHNNCSGKHTGFLTTAKFYQEELKDYINYQHPVQQRIVTVLEEMAGISLAEAPKGVDGCGIPVVGISLRHTALAMARFANPLDIPIKRQQAIQRITRAIQANPLMIAGHGRFCSLVTQQLHDRGFVKVGAEGVYIAVLPKQGLGITLKTADGAIRAAEMGMIKILLEVGALTKADYPALEKFLHPIIKNRAGLKVGEIR